MITATIILIEKTIEKWMIISVDHFQANLVKMGVGDVDGDLMRSFVYQVQQNGGDGYTVLIKFLKYGRFVDMQVGRGHPIGNPGTRLSKKWYSKQKTKEVAILRFIMAKQYGMLAIQMLETELKQIDNQ